MQDSIEHIEIRIAFLKSLHILRQASSSDFSVRRANARVLHIANLHHIFVEALALVCGSHHALRNLVLEDMLIVARVYFPICSFLPCVVTLNGSAK